MNSYLQKPFAYCKTVFIVFISVLFSLQIIAQAPVNDNCSGATLLTSATSCNPVTGTFIRATSTSSPNWVVTYNANNTWTRPSGVRSVVVECWGAGGAGGGASNTNTRGGGGGGGAYTYNNSLNVGLASYSVVVGSGGTGGTGLGPSGGPTNFGSGLVNANGGTGGGGATTSGAIGAGGNGGTGGTFAGGNGAAGTAVPTSGAGGGGAGSGGAGGNALGIIAGMAGAIDGGTGAAGRFSDAVGNIGSSNGGGGGGGLRTGGTTRNGGNGASGFMRISMSGDLNSPDVWYRFVAASASPTIILSNIDTGLVNKKLTIHLLTGACGSQTTIFSETTNTLSTSGLTIGATYFIRITTNTNFVSPTSGAYDFDICVMDPLPTPFNFIDFSKSYVNITDGVVGGTINQGDILEIRATLVVKTGASTITNVSFYDTLKRNAGFIFKDSIATRTNEGKRYKSFTNATGDDAGWLAPTGLDTAIQINIGTGATAATGGTLTNNSIPNFYSTCIIMATYRVRVDTGIVGYGRKINFGGGAIRYSIGASNYTISFPRDSLIVYPTLTACSDAVSPANLIGNAANGTFGVLAVGSSPSGTQNGGQAAVNTTYNYETISSGPNDYYYGVTNNTSKINAINQTVPKGDPSRVFDVFDISGDHTGAADQAKGNKPCDPTQVVSATNPCGYLMLVNAAYKSDVVFEYTATGACAETYYEVSAWFKNICYKCGADSLARSGGNAGYIPTAPGDSSGVRPNISMKIDGIDYYTTGELVYQGLGGTQSGSDTLNNWVRRSFVFKTGPTQTSFKITFRNNAPGGGGNDWAIDDIGLRTCFPTMVYSPSNPIVYMGNALTIRDTVRSYFNSYSYYQWERKPVSGAWAPIVGASGNATPVWNPVYNQYEYVISYTIPGTATLAGNAGDLYRMVVASSLPNLTNGCNYTPSLSFTLLPTDAPCALTATNYAIAPQTGNIDWNKLDWSLGHVPTCCESAHITYNSSNGSADAITVDITNDICIINLTLVNSSSTANQIFKTILHPGYNMQMNGNVRMGAPATAATDSCIFIAKGGGTITVNGNTVIGYPSDNAYCNIGSAPGTSTYANYMLKGDSLTFNARAFTNHRFTDVTLDPSSGAAKLVNNTNVAPYPNAVTFDRLKIGNTTAKTVTSAGTNQNAFLNDNNGNLEVTAGSTLIMPANYTINAKDFLSAGTFKTDVILRANSTLVLGGISGGIAGSNFPANSSSYSLAPTSTVLFNGAAQSIPGTVNNVNAYGNITLSGTGVKTASASNVILAGNFYRTNTGHTFNANGGRVTFLSSINGQRYYADAGATQINFYDFTNNNTNASGLSIDSTIGITNQLELRPSSRFTLNTGDVIMLSSAARTSHIANLGTTIPTITYNGSYRFVIERYLFGDKAWRFLASPVRLLGSDATTPTVAAAWREGVSALSSTGYGTAITGPSGPNAQLDYYTQRGSMKYYNDVTNAWVELTNTTSTRIANTQGYMVFVRGDRGAPNTTSGAGTATNLRIKGQIRTSDQTFNVLANKNQSIGNPFASQINFGTITKPGITNSFIVWNPLSTGLYGVGGYENYSIVGANYRLNGLAGGAIRNTIESGEAFFVQNNTASATTVTIKESDKGILSSMVSRPGNADIIIPTIDISLFEKANGNYVMMDGASTSFDDSFSAGLDNDDVIKFTNTYDNLFITSNNKNLVVERRPSLTVNDTIKLGLTGTRIANYKFQIDPYVLENIGLDPFLFDKYLQTETALSVSDSTDVYFDITADAGSKVANRFMIVFKQALPVYNFTTIAATRNADKTVTVNWGIQNETNVNNYTVEQSNDGINFTVIGIRVPSANNGTNPTYTKIDNAASKAANWYRVKATSLNNTIKYSPIVMVNALQEGIENNFPTISIRPNPIVDGDVNLNLEYQAEGPYTVNLINDLGQIIRTEKIMVKSNIEKFKIRLGKISAGTYQASITDKVGNTTNIPFIVM